MKLVGVMDHWLSQSLTRTEQNQRLWMIVTKMAVVCVQAPLPEVLMISLSLPPTESIIQGKKKQTETWIKSKAREQIKNVTKAKFLAPFIVFNTISTNSDTSGYLSSPVEQSKMIGYIVFNIFYFFEAIDIYIQTGIIETLNFPVLSLSPRTNWKYKWNVAVTISWILSSLTLLQGIWMWGKGRDCMGGENYHTCWVGKFPKCCLKE